MGTQCDLHLPNYTAVALTGHEKRGVWKDNPNQPPSLSSINCLSSPWEPARAPPHQMSGQWIARGFGSNRIVLFPEPPNGSTTCTGETPALLPPLSNYTSLQMPLGWLQASPRSVTQDLGKDTPDSREALLPFVSITIQPPLVLHIVRLRTHALLLGSQDTAVDHSGLYQVPLMLPLRSCQQQCFPPSKESGSFDSNVQNGTESKVKHNTCKLKGLSQNSLGLDNSLGCHLNLKTKYVTCQKVGTVAFEGRGWLLTGQSHSAVSPGKRLPSNTR